MVDTSLVKGDSQVAGAVLPEAEFRLPGLLALALGLGGHAGYKGFSEIPLGQALGGGCVVCLVGGHVLVLPGRCSVPFGMCIYHSTREK